LLTLIFKEITCLIIDRVTKMQARLLHGQVSPAINIELMWVFLKASFQSKTPDPIDRHQNTALWFRQAVCLVHAIRRVANRLGQS